MKLLLIGHQGFGNRGCEAIVRSTAALVRTRHPQAILQVPSAHPEADAAQWPEHADFGVRFIAAPQMSARFSHWGRLCRLLPAAAAWGWPRPMLDAAHLQALSDSDLVLSIGGDNLTLDYGLPSLAFHVGMAEAAQRRGIPVVLWGASVGPFDRWPAVEQRMRRHLAQLQAITVRESISASWLAGKAKQNAASDGRDRTDIGLTSEPPTTRGTELAPRLVPTRDPAFTLQAQAMDLEPHWPATDRPVLGLNLSPLASGQAVEAGAAFAVGVIERGHAVLLVPHVSAHNGHGVPVQAITPQQDDVPRLEAVRRSVVERLGHQAPITLLPAGNAAQIKHAVSRCHSFVGARTHSVIAALSSGVPALALAYSPKARGIHRDLLGHEAGVLPLRGLTADRLMQAWELLQERHATERDLLAARLPLWRTQAAAAVDALG